MKEKNLAVLRQDIQFDTILRGHQFSFTTTWGLFNPRDVDEGSRLLIGHIEVSNPASDILDIGCGYGAIGIALAHLAPQGTVDMVDKDFVAVEYAARNAQVNGTSAKAFLSNGLSAVPQNKKYDMIVSNLPAKVGNELLYIMMNDAKDHLHKGGRLYVVVISGLKDYIKRNFKEVFGNYKKVKQSKTYSVFYAEK